MTRTRSTTFEKSRYIESGPVSSTTHSLSLMVTHAKNKNPGVKREKGYIFLQHSSASSSNLLVKHQFLSNNTLESTALDLFDGTPVSHIIIPQTQKRTRHHHGEFETTRIHEKKFSLASVDDWKGVCVMCDVGMRMIEFVTLRRDLQHHRAIRSILLW